MHNRAYTSQGEKVHRVVTDLNITSDNNSGNNQKVQTVRVGLPIPRGTMPTILLEQSQLLSVSYFIRVQVFAQEGVYTTSEGTKSQFMTVDLPFVVGTLASTDSNAASPTLTNNNASSPTLTNRSVSPSTSPMSSPRSTYTSLSSIFTPQQQQQQQQRQQQNVSPQLQPQPLQQQQSFDTGSTNEKTTEGSDTASISTSSNQLETSNSINRKSKIMGNIFRKSSTGSSVSTGSNEEKKKKKGVFSTLRLYSSKKNSDQSNEQAETESVGSQKEDQQQQVSPAVVMTAKHNEPDPSQQQQQQGGIFDIFAGDDVDDDDDIPRNHSKIEQKNSTQDHDDGTTVISSESTPPSLPPRPVQEPTTTPPPALAGGQGRFQMFPDDDDSDDEEEEQTEQTIQEQTSVAMATSGMDQEINSTADNLDDLTFDDRSNPQAPPPSQPSNVFRMFDDDDSDDDEEEIVNQLTVSQERIAVLIDERVKPHHLDDSNDKPNTYNYYYKPNTMTDSSEDEHDENDLLAALARREKSL